MNEYIIDNELKLRIPNQPEDAKRIYRLVNESRTTLKQWLPWAAEQTLDDEIEFIKLSLNQPSNRVSFNLIIEFKNIVVGMISFNRFDKTENSGEIGYWLGNQYVGNGIMQRALKKLVEIGFTEFKLKNCYIWVAVNNRRSNRVAEQGGFTLINSVPNKIQLLDTRVTANCWNITND
ncbi:GNAT family N-acetyltransferase [Fructilactobacillus vespulae]|uniref:GNAT family N-acetyltransferase n=1 Tax=Fructilactobacillus vespulae TaxID=1249630 RepID=UPI0039B45D2B